MSNEPASLLSSVTRVIENLASNEDSYDNLVIILSLLCLLTILNRNQRPSAPAVTQNNSSSAGNTLQKLMGDLSKGDGAPSADTLMSLLPLLNSPQVKSKLNPSTMASVLGLLNNFGGSGASSNDKQEASKQEKADVKDRGELRSESRKDNTAPSLLPNIPHKAPVPNEGNYAADDGDSEDKRGIGRYLNWKNNF